MESMLALPKLIAWGVMALMVGSSFAQSPSRAAGRTDSAPWVVSNGQTDAVLDPLSRPLRTAACPHRCRRHGVVRASRFRQVLAIGRSANRRA
jgi:hypothetical protein